MRVQRVVTVIAISFTLDIQSTYPLSPGPRPLAPRSALRSIATPIPAEDDSRCSEGSDEALEHRSH